MQQLNHLQKKNISSIAIIRVGIFLALIILALYANYFAIKKMGRYAIEVDFYNKISVAFDMAGVEGVKEELAKIKEHDKLRHELITAAEFERIFPNLSNPEAYIDNTLSEKNSRLKLIMHMRRIAIVLILLILGARLLLSPKLNKNRKV